MSINSTYFFSNFHHCLESTAGFSIITAFLATKFFLFLPLSLLVFSIGLQRWWQQRSTTTSHSDIFTYHLVAMELVYVLGIIIYTCGTYSGLSGAMMVGYYLCSVVLPGQTSLHILTCVDRYLAVVHPVVYLRLRQSRGVRIRNISTGCVWLLCIGWVGLTALYSPDTPYVPFFCILLFSLVVVSFCSLSVLHVLIRPSPGEVSGNREVNKSKKRAFNTITAITGVLWFFFAMFFICVTLNSTRVLSSNDGCLALMCGYWASVPSSLISPVMFLHRTGKLICCHCSNK